VEVAELAFRVMASEARVVLVDPSDGAASYARRRLDELEGLWSRFRDGSDITRLNTMTEALVPVSRETVELLATMKLAWRLTQGRYDPTMLAAINAIGYSTSIDGSGRVSRMATARARYGTIADVYVDVVGAAVLPAGIGLDPGGIGKGLAADLVVTELVDAGTAGALVSIGGDLAAAGTPPVPAGWYVAVEDPLDSAAALVTFALSAGGVATSSTLSRSWCEGRCRRHHVIDPSTQTCSTTDLAAVTVIARAGWEAEAHATAALLCGSEGAFAYLERHQLDGVVCRLDGTSEASPALTRCDRRERSVA